MQPVNSGPGGSQQQNQIKVRLATPCRIGLYLIPIRIPDLLFSGAKSPFMWLESSIRNVKKINFTVP